MAVSLTARKTTQGTPARLAIAANPADSRSTIAVGCRGEIGIAAPVASASSRRLSSAVSAIRVAVTAIPRRAPHAAAAAATSAGIGRENAAVSFVDHAVDDDQRSDVEVRGQTAGDADDHDPIRRLRDQQRAQATAGVALAVTGHGQRHASRADPAHGHVRAGDEQIARAEHARPHVDDLFFHGRDDAGERSGI